LAVIVVDFIIRIIVAAACFLNMIYVVKPAVFDLPISLDSQYIIWTLCWLIVINIYAYLTREV
jgi:hypothetical protein